MLSYRSDVTYVFITSNDGCCLLELPAPGQILQCVFNEAGSGLLSATFRAD